MSEGQEPRGHESAPLTCPQWDRVVLLPFAGVWNLLTFDPVVPRVRPIPPSTAFHSVSLGKQ